MSSWDPMNRPAGCKLNPILQPPQPFNCSKIDTRKSKQGSCQFFGHTSSTKYGINNPTGGSKVLHFGLWRHRLCHRGCSEKVGPTAWDNFNRALVAVQLSSRSILVPR